MKKAVADLLPAVERSCDLLVDAEEKACWAEMELSLIKHREKSFEEAKAVVNKKLSAARRKCAALCWNQKEFFPKLKVLETHLGESLQAVNERTTEGSSVTSSQFETEVAQVLERISAEFKYEDAKSSARLKTSLSESIFDAQCKIANFVAMLSNRLASGREASSVEPSAST